MSGITTSYDAIVALIAAELPGYVQLPDPYLLESENELLLAKGFAVRIETGTNSERFLGCKSSWVQQYPIFLVNQLEVTPHDTVGKADAVKAIAEDAYKIFIALESDHEALGTGVKSVAQTTGGVELLSSDREKFIIIESVIEVEFFQNI